MNIEKLEDETTEFTEVKDDEVLDLVKECFESKTWVRTGDVFVLYIGKNSLPYTVQVFTIKKVRTYVDRDSELWNDKRPRCSKEELLLLKEKIFGVIKSSTEE